MVAKLKHNINKFSVEAGNKLANADDQKINDKKNLDNSEHVLQQNNQIKKLQKIIQQQEQIIAKFKQDIEENIELNKLKVIIKNQSTELNKLKLATKSKQSDGNSKIIDSIPLLKTWVMAKFTFAEYMNNNCVEDFVTIKNDDFPISISYKSEVVEYFLNVVECLEIREEKRDRGRPSQQFRWDNQKFEIFFSSH